MSCVMTCPAAPVQEMRTSAAAMAAGRSASPAILVTVVLTLAASRSACSRVRLATTMLAAPLLAAVAAASALIEPAPTMSTSRPASASGPEPTGPRLVAASSTAALSRLRPARPIPVSARARLPVRSASWPSSPSTRPAVPCSAASLTAERTWPRIWSSPTTIESSPAATASRWLTARSS